MSGLEFSGGGRVGPRGGRVVVAHGAVAAEVEAEGLAEIHRGTGGRQTDGDGRP